MVGVDPSLVHGVVCSVARYIRQPTVWQVAVGYLVVCRTIKPRFLQLIPIGIVGELLLVEELHHLLPPAAHSHGFLLAVLRFQSLGIVGVVMAARLIAIRTVIHYAQRVAIRVVGRYAGFVSLGIGSRFGVLVGELRRLLNVVIPHSLPIHRFPV